MADKAMEEVMREFKKKVEAMDACGYDCSECIESINKFIDKACRMYAQKVLEELESNVIAGMYICKAIEIARDGLITDKEPK